MRRFGFIGYGSMGSMLVKGLVHSGQVDPEQLIVTRKNIDRLDEIKGVDPRINTAINSSEVVKASDYIFLCVIPRDIKGVLKEIAPLLKPNSHIISIAGSPEIAEMEKLVHCKISKLMPTVISEVGEGISLICHNTKVSENEADTLEKMLLGFTRIKRISEESFGFASNLTSCGPGFYSAILNEFAEAGVRRSKDFDKDEISQMILYTVYGTARLMIEKHMDFSSAINRVAVKGGITREGVNVMEEKLPAIFDEVLDRADDKRAFTNKLIKDAFSGQN